MHYIFTSTTKELRDKHYQEFLDIYYEILSNFIKRLNLDPEKLFPRYIFDEHLKKFGKFGLYMGILCLPAVTSNAEDTPDIDAISEKLSEKQNGEKLSIDFVPSERCMERILGVYEDMYNFGKMSNKDNSSDFKIFQHAVYQKAMNEIAKTYNLNYKEKYIIEYYLGSTKGENFIASIYRIQIKDRKDQSIKLSLIGKLPPKDENRRKRESIKIGFQREILFYEEIYPIFKQFQLEKNIDVDILGFYEVPKCHKTLNVNQFEGIFLEDLKFKNFQLFDRKKNVTKDHVVLVLKALAKMHTIFFAIKDQCPMIVENYTEIDDFMLKIYDENSLLNFLYNSQKNLALNVLRKLENSENKRKIENFFNTNLLEIINELLGKKVAEPHAVICHGDCWINNMMFRYDDNGKPNEVCLFDFQLIRYASPVLDIIQYIFTSTTKALRDEFYDEFLDIYYETFSNFLKKLDSDPVKLFPRYIFDEHLKRFGKYGLFITNLVMPVITNETEFLELGEVAQNLKDNNFIVSQRYEERMLEIFEDISAATMELKIVNISMKNAIMSREFYWNHLGIKSFNEAFSKAQPKRQQVVQIFIPQMPLSTPSLHIVLDIENLSISEDKELKVFKRLTCDCSMKQNRLKRVGSSEHCPHRNIAEIRPACVKIKASQITQFELICRYEFLGQHEISFIIGSSCYSIQLKLFVDTIDFNPLTMLLTYKLAPVAIDVFPPWQQVLWFHNPYTCDIKLKIISHNTKLLSVINEIIIVKSHEHVPVFVIFNPYYIDCYDIPIGIQFNECECVAQIHVECKQFDSIVQFNSPMQNFPSQLNPFVLHSDNLCILMRPNSSSNENLIALQNCSKFCVKYQWKNMRLSEFSCEIFVKPNEGFLRAGATKLFRLTINSFGCEMQLQSIPLSCSIYRFNNEHFRDIHSLPDGYFEYTEKGYFEKPQNWSPMASERLTILYANLNVIVTNKSLKYAEGSNDKDALTTAQQINNEKCCMNVPMTTIINNHEAKEALNVCDVNDDEKNMAETIIRNASESEHQSASNKCFYEELTQQQSNENTSYRFIPKLMNDVLFECITAIAQERSFIPNTL
ncbi:hypothetical protein PVAND_000513 [Polypedilum vanderplanki]|uniref:CHK kinase-like domain-containing protein n=1 Tax=Polypedilum vanderplanki TaxID=319348 RepID=A0A9J6BK73_POLVA|nr:hypothetical protein PVAND_000513 [Polypedilum vanderplanki]